MFVFIVRRTFLSHIVYDIPLETLISPPFLFLYAALVLRQLELRTSYNVILLRILR